MPQVEPHLQFAPQQQCPERAFTVEVKGQAPAARGAQTLAPTKLIAIAETMMARNSRDARFITISIRHKVLEVFESLAVRMVF
jgi:hypothetical protein